MNLATTYHRLDASNADLLAMTEVFDNPVDPVQLAAFVADPGHQMVFAVDRGRVVGMASGTVLLHPDKQPAFLINEVGVEDDLRRRGIGAALCRHLIDLARGLGCQGVWLATETDNDAARGLYRKLDARETGAVVVYDWDGALDD